MLAFSILLHFFVLNLDTLSLFFLNFLPHVPSLKKYVFYSYLIMFFFALDYKLYEDRDHVDIH